MSHYAVIDLGTNTFHLLVVKKTDQLFEEVYRKRVFVNIAEEGISTLGENCYDRGIDTILEFKRILSNYPGIKLQVFGTAALRTATNGPQFQKEIKDKTNITIQIIHGQREAALISKGTKAIVDTSEGNYLIMDIGGGSVEFILIQNGEDIYMHSFPIGITALYNQYPHNEPINEVDIKKINQYLSKVLKPLKQKIQDIDIDGLIGASGSYEVLERILSRKISKNKSSRFPIAQIIEQMNIIISQDLEERLANELIPNQRAKLIVIAFILISHVLKLSQFQSLIISPYALKEGAIMEML